MKSHVIRVDFTEERGELEVPQLWLTMPGEWVRWVGIRVEDDLGDSGGGLRDLVGVAVEEL